MSQEQYAPAPPDETPMGGPEDPDEEAHWDDDRQHRQRVLRAAKRLRADEDARQLLRRERREQLTRPRVQPLTEFLAQPCDDPTYRIDGLWPTGGRVMLPAPFKGGKTTLVGNLIRALADGDDFLDRFTVTPGAHIALIDDELDARTLQRWITDQDIANPTAVSITALRGHLGTFDIRDPEVRAEWARDLAGADVLILDCLRPVLDALGLDENHDAGRFLVAIDALLAEAGISEALVVHHMGHGAERSRGDSRLNDWPDAIWTLVRDKSDDDPTVDDVAGSRYFSAFGRDVNITQAELVYDHTTRRLSLGEANLNRRQATSQRRTAKADEAVIAAVTAHPGILKTQLRHDVRTLHDIGRNEDIDNAVDRLVTDGRIRRIRVGNAQQHYPGEERLPETPAQDAQPAPTPLGHMGVIAPAPLIGGATTTTPTTHDNHCIHGMPGGQNPDDFVNGRLACPACAQEAS